MEEDIRKLEKEMKRLRRRLRLYTTKWEKARGRAKEKWARLISEIRGKLISLGKKIKKLRRLPRITFIRITYYLRYSARKPSWTRRWELRVIYPVLFSVIEALKKKHEEYMTLEEVIRYRELKDKLDELYKKQEELLERIEELEPVLDISMFSELAEYFWWYFGIREVPHPTKKERYDIHKLRRKRRIHINEFSWLVDTVSSITGTIIMRLNILLKLITREPLTDEEGMYYNMYLKSKVERLAREYGDYDTAYAILLRDHLIRTVKLFNRFLPPEERLTDEEVEEYVELMFTEPEYLREVIDRIRRFATEVRDMLDELSDRIDELRKKERERRKLREELEKVRKEIERVKKELDVLRRKVVRRLPDIIRLTWDSTLSALEQMGLDVNYLKAMQLAQSFSVGIEYASNVNLPYNPEVGEIEISGKKRKIEPCDLAYATIQVHDIERAGYQCRVLLCRWFPWLFKHKLLPDTYRKLCEKCIRKGYEDEPVERVPPDIFEVEEYVWADF